MSGATAVGHRHLIGIALKVAAVVALLAGVDVGAAGNSAAAAASSQTRLPVPRFVSLKSDKVNVRRGPSTDQAIVWVFSRAGLPVEIIAESDNWRRVRDSEGADGWVWHSLLSGRRTVLIAPWTKQAESVPLLSRKSTGASTIAELQPSVLGNVLSCDGEWCELSIDSYSGFVQQDKLWGVYRGEVVK
jgi:SH3-like domain-containing protein